MDVLSHPDTLWLNMNFQRISSSFSEALRAIVQGGFKALAATNRYVRAQP